MKWQQLLLLLFTKQNLNKVKEMLCCKFVYDLFISNNYKCCYLQQSAQSDVVKWLSPLTLNQVSEVRVLALELYFALKSIIMFWNTLLTHSKNTVESMHMLWTIYFPIIFAKMRSLSIDMILPSSWLFVISK